MGNLFSSRLEDAFNNFLLQILSLPLLPAERIRGVFFNLKRSLNNETRGQLEEFLIYYQEQWLQGVSPQNFSVFRNLQQMTTSFEFYSNALQTAMGNSPEAWEFTSMYERNVIPTII